jgi:hypothetical protein
VNQYSDVLLSHNSSCFALLLASVLQGFACSSVKACAGSTVWGVAHLPDNRDVSMVTCGDGSMSLWKYSYPDQRKIKVLGYLPPCSVQHTACYMSLHAGTDGCFLTFPV